jgi:hypothetical protein
MDQDLKTYRVWATETCVRDVEYIVHASSEEEATNLAKDGDFADSYIVDEYVDGEPRFWLTKELHHAV